jgi:hypothetical protein
MDIDEQDSNQSPEFILSILSIYVKISETMQLSPRFGVRIERRFFTGFPKKRL